jgi:hypothetical protein
MEAYRVVKCRVPGSQMAAPRSTPRVSGTHFCSRMNKPQGLVRLEGLDRLTRIIELEECRLLGYYDVWLL